MAGRIVWSDRAIEDLKGIAAYIGADSEFYARRTVKAIRRAAERLRTFPLCGAVVPEYGRDDLRDVLWRSDRIFYTCHRDQSSHRERSTRRSPITG